MNDMPDEDISFNDLIASSIHDMKNSLNMQICALEKIAMCPPLMVWVM